MANLEIIDEIVAFGGMTLAMAGLEIMFTYATQGFGYSLFTSVASD